VADTTNKKSNFISSSVQAGVAILDNIDELRALLREAQVLDYATILTDADFIGPDPENPGGNAHLTKAQLVALFATIGAVVTLLEANSNAHYKNLYALKP
jgi:hypothetical protein